MRRTITATYDGRVLRPDAPTGLTPHARYVLTVEPADEAAQESDAWDVLEGLAGTVEAPHDWSREHDHYLYGTPKRESMTPE